MSSMIRTIEKRILREKGKLAPRKSPRNKTLGEAFRHCVLEYNEDGTIKSWTRNH